MLDVLTPGREQPDYFKGTFYRFDLDQFVRLNWELICHISHDHSYISYAAFLELNLTLVQYH